MNEAGNAPNWTVVNQIQQGGMNSAGQYVTGWLVTFRTRSGAEGNVHIPDSEYTPDIVRARVSEKAAQLNAISGMSG